MLSVLLVSILLADPSNQEGTASPGSWSYDATPQLQGPLTAATVRAGLDGVAPAVKACYTTLQAQYPTQSGALEVGFVVSPEGAATEVSAVDPRFPVAWFQGCVADALNDAHFQTAGTATTVSWTLNLDDGAFAAPAPTGLLGYKATSEDPGPATVKVVGTATESPIILGALDKSLIDAVIKRNLSKVRDCYTKELRETPTLAGKITVKFVIAKDGTVSKAETKTTTMNNAEVEGCINKAFLKFEFPEPKGGGIVIVSYPFVFSPG